MSDLNELHDQAMELADDADVARRRGKLDEANALYYQAYKLELEVAQSVNVEPSRSVMYRSAAALALECNLLDEAQAMAQAGLTGETPLEIIDELQEIIAEVASRREKRSFSRSVDIQGKHTDSNTFLDFAASPLAVRAVAEAIRLTFGHMFNPAFATEISAIEPLPHQRIAVYDKMLPQTRLRFLLADDAGAGKTIMSGLYIREMLSRRLINRVLIVPPAGLVGNWQREMAQLFNLPFRVIRGGDARRDNPFAQADSDLVIVSVDTLSSDRMFGRLKESSTLPYDLVIFDEAHKLAANRDADYTVRRTERYKLAEALTGVSSNGMKLDWSCRHLLLLSATPHMGREYPYYALWRLLEPEILSTPEAFEAYPANERQKHFIRRTKEEMVRFDGTPVYPKRISDTLSYDLTQGEISEQILYDQTTEYIRFYYNRARILNRSAARLAMSVFQRRLASSTYALLQSFERRIEKLDGLIADVEAGKIDLKTSLQKTAKYGLDEHTADEDENDPSEIDEETVLRGVVAVSLAELKTERDRVQDLLRLAQQVHEKGDESKLQKLLEVIRDPKYRNEKLIIFTEHRDTLDFLVRRLEGMGFTGEIARLHGGMDYTERDQQVELFKKPLSEGGAKYLVATDAAGEGINLQFCWLMVNYDIPWNPARLEQRMGRIHRYGQQHDPVIIMNLIAGKTREGRVLKTLLDKLKKIREELGSDKVFDVVGRLFEGKSLREYMEEVLTQGETAAEKAIEEHVTIEAIAAIQQEERAIYGLGGDVQSMLSEANTERERTEALRLLPGYVRRFVEEAAPLVDVKVEGDIDQLRPGLPEFEQFRAEVIDQLSDDAQRGGVFVDPIAEQPYLFHLAQMQIVRQIDPNVQALRREEVIETQLVGLRQTPDGAMSETPVEALLLLRGGEHSAASLSLVAHSAEFLTHAKNYAQNSLGATRVAYHRETLQASIPDRERFIRQGFQYEESELASTRTKIREKANAGNKAAKAELERIRMRQRQLTEHRDASVRVLHREPELIGLDSVTFIAHALVMPSSDPEDRRRYDAEVEATAMRIARVYEEMNGATVYDVSTPEGARAAGLLDNPGFDLLSRYPNGIVRNIEVKGRAQVGDVELSENEWAKACNLRDQYWLYTVFNCASANPQLRRVRDPFGKLIAQSRGVRIDEKEIFLHAERN